MGIAKITNMHHSRNPAKTCACGIALKLRTNTHKYPQHSLCRIHPSHDDCPRTGSSTSQTRTTWSSHPLTTSCPSADQATLRMLFACPHITRRADPNLVSQSRIVLSALPLTRHFSSGDSAMLNTEPVCPSSLCFLEDLCMSWRFHIMTA